MICVSVTVSFDNFQTFVKKMRRACSGPEFHVNFGSGRVSSSQEIGPTSKIESSIAAPLCLCHQAALFDIEVRARKVNSVSGRDRLPSIFDVNVHIERKLTWLKTRKHR